MYARYMDDIIMALNVVNKGWFFNRKMSVIQFYSDLQGSDTRDKEKRTAETLVEVAKSINSNIRLTWDTPQENNNERMPVLDLAIWVQDVEGRQVIMQTFYNKKVASKYTVLKRSALFNKIKNGHIDKFITKMLA